MRLAAEVISIWFGRVLNRQTICCDITLTYLQTGVEIELGSKYFGWCYQGLELSTADAVNATLLDWDPAPPPKRGTVLPPKGAQPPNFRPMSVVAIQLDRSRCHLVQM